MIDPVALTTITTSVVAVLSPLLGKAIDKAAEKVGELTITSLVDKFKNRIPDKAKDAVNELAINPTDADEQAALRAQLKKAIQADPELLSFFEQWLTEAKPVAKSKNAVTQTANVNDGDGNEVYQIAGSGISISR